LLPICALQQDKNQKTANNPGSNPGGRTIYSTHTKLLIFLLSCS